MKSSKLKVCCQNTLKKNKNTMISSMHCSCGTLLMPYWQNTD